MQFDAIVIGGSFAGLSAAMQLARAGRPVLVVDAGRPRNRYSDRSHGFFGQDGSSPTDMLRMGREKLLAYSSVKLLHDTAIDTKRNRDGFSVQLALEGDVSARALVVATGVEDVLPDIPGLQAHWGRSVLHCPYCHGYEFKGERLGVLAASALAIHQATLIADWGPVTLFVNGQVINVDDRTRLEATGITIEDAPVARVIGDGHRLMGVELADGRTIAITAIYIASATRMASPIAEQLGCAFDDGPFGPVIRTDAWKLTTVPRVYAAGDAARVPQNASWASADGVTAGIALHQALVFGFPDH